MRRTALIVGGTSGIGLAIAEALAPDHDLILVSSGRGSREIDQQFLGRAQVLQHDLKKPCDIPALAAEIPAGTNIGILVNSFGRRRDDLFLLQSSDQIEALIVEHLLLPTLLCRFALESMFRLGFGRILNIGSIGSRHVKSGQVAYAAAKAGLEGLTRALALEAAHRGVTVNLIQPGLIATPSTEAHLDKLKEKHPKLRSVVPRGRFGQPRDVAGLAKFLCSDEADYITGAAFVVDGGRSLGDPSL